MKLLKSRTALFALIAALCGLLALFTPPVLDDLTYMGDSVDYSLGLRKLAAGMDELYGHFMWDVGRLSNVLAVLFLCLFPRWVFAVFQACAVFVLLEYGCRFMRLREKSLWSLVYAVLVVFGLPWHDSIVVLDFSLNYVWPSAMIVALFYLMFVRSCSAGVATVMLALAAGWMHESFSVPVCCGFAAAALYDRRVFTRPRLILACAFCVGAALNFAFPGIWVRAAGHTMDIRANFTPVSILFSSMGFVAAVAAPLAWRVAAGRLPRTQVVMMMVATLVSLGIFFCVGIKRAAWIPQFYGTVCTVMALGVFRVRVGRGFAVAASALCAAAMLVSLSVSIFWTCRFNREYDSVVRRVRDSGCDYIYADPLVMPPSAELLTFGRVKSDHFRELLNLELFGRYYCRGNVFRLLPSCLRDFSEAEAQELSPGSGIYVFRGVVVATPQVAGALAGSGYSTVKVGYSDGSVATRALIRQRFIDSGGREWVHLLLPRRFGADRTDITHIAPAS